MKSDYSYELAQSIRKIQQQKGDFFCPIIVNTGHELAEEKDLLFKYGVNEFYRKPKATEV